MAHPPAAKGPPGKGLKKTKEGIDMTTSKTLWMIAVAGVAVACLVGSANAGLMYDLRAVGGTNVTVLDSHTVNVADVGAVVNLQLWATVTGTDTLANDGFLQGGGSILGSAAGKLKGDMSIGTNVSPFTNTVGAQPGQTADLNGDGYLDLGSTNTSTSTPYFMAVSDSGLTAVMGSAANPSFLLGTFTYTVKAGGLNDSTTLTFIPRVKSGSGSTLHKIAVDGATNVLSYTGTNPALTTDGYITLSMVPEPATMALLGLGGLGMLLRRRRA